MLLAPDSQSTVRTQVKTDEIILTGRAWVVDGPVSTEAIITHTAQQARDAEDTILLVTGRVGDGSHAQAAQAAEALQHSGISSVIASRFAWPFFRMCINIGLPPLTLWEAGEIRAHDRLRIDVNDSIVKDLSSGTRYPVRDLSDLYVDILACGGMTGYVQALQEERVSSQDS
jgi:3-isopropylmalate dehydratase small subunit